MFKFKLAVIVVGGMVAFWGFEEFQVSRGTSDEPMVVELSVLENDTRTENNHIQIGEHMALYPYCVYEYQVKKGYSEPTDNAKVNHTYYPIISNSHPYIAELATLSEKYGALKDVPDAEWPEVKDFVVLVKTESFRTIGAIPDYSEVESSIQGLVINRISELDEEEKRLVSESFPALDLNKIIILEEGRKPSSSLKSFGMMGGGVVIGLLGVASFFGGGRRETLS